MKNNLKDTFFKRPFEISKDLLKKNLYIFKNIVIVHFYSHSNKKLSRPPRSIIKWVCNHSSHEAYNKIPRKGE